MASPLGMVLRESTLGGDVRTVALQYAARTVLEPHLHEDAYLSIVASGGYTEVHAVIPRRCESGTVIAHDSSEQHADYFSTDTICVNIYGAETTPERARVWANELSRCALSGWMEAFQLVEHLLDGYINRLLDKQDERLPDKRIDDGARASDPRNPTLALKPAWLERVMNGFAWTSNEPLRAAAAYGGVHPAHFARAFHEHVGITPGAYRNRLKINEASKRLLEGPGRLSEIATEAGFYDQSDLTNRFRSASGMTPAHYRSVFRR